MKNIRENQLKKCIFMELENFTSLVEKLTAIYETEEAKTSDKLSISDDKTANEPVYTDAIVLITHNKQATPILALTAIFFNLFILSLFMLCCIFY